MELNWENMKASCKCRPITKAAIHRGDNKYSANLGKFPRKNPWQSSNLVKLQKLQVFTQQIY